MSFLETRPNLDLFESKYLSNEFEENNVHRNNVLQEDQVIENYDEQNFNNGSNDSNETDADLEKNTVVENNKNVEECIQTPSDGTNLKNTENITIAATYGPSTNVETTNEVLEDIIDEVVNNPESQTPEKNIFEILDNKIQEATEVKETIDYKHLEDFDDDIDLITLLKVLIPINEFTKLEQEYFVKVKSIVSYIFKWIKIPLLEPIYDDLKIIVVYALFLITKTSLAIKCNEIKSSLTFQITILAITAACIIGNCFAKNNKEKCYQNTKDISTNSNIAVVEPVDEEPIDEEPETSDNHESEKRYSLKRKMSSFANAKRKSYY